MTVNDTLQDHQISEAIKWVRYASARADEIRRILMRSNRRLSEIIRDGVSDNPARQKALRSTINEFLVKFYYKEVEPMVELMALTVVNRVAQAEVAEFKRLLPKSIDILMPNPGVLKTAALDKPFNGATLDDWFKQLVAGDVTRTWQTTLDGIISGETTDDIIANVNGTKSLNYKDGVREVTRRGAEVFVRTTITAATNAGRQSVWEENSDVIKCVKWVSTLDTRTSDICRHNDGRVGPVAPDENFSPPAGSQPLSPPMARPPAHANCRSTTVAVMKSWEELGFSVDELPEGTRASMDGQVPANQTYYKWLSNQSPERQIEALGKKRYEDWKEKGINPDRFEV